MKAVILLAATFSLLISSVSVALAGGDGKKNNVPFYITSPMQGTVYKGGERVTIRKCHLLSIEDKNAFTCIVRELIRSYRLFYHVEWINGIHGPAKLRLLQGANDDDMEVVVRHQIALDGDIGSYKWTVPSDLPSKDKYAFQFMYPIRTKSKKKGGEKFEFDYSYSGSFRILNSSNNTIYTPTPSLTKGYSAPTSSIHAIIPGYTHSSSSSATVSRHDQLVPSPSLNTVSEQEGSASSHAALSVTTLSISIFGIISAALII